MRAKGLSPLLVVIIVAVVGTVAFLFYKLSPLQNVGLTPVSEGQVEGDRIKRDLGILSKSDDINVIDRELNSTNFDKIDEGLDSELKQAGF